MRVGIHITSRAAAVAVMLIVGASAALAQTPPVAASPHATPAARPASAPPAKPKPKPAPRLDINSATKAQLKKLPGVGDAEADRIIAHRPYLVSTEIVSKAGLPEGLYIQLRRKIVAIPKSPPKKAKTSP